MSVSRPPLQAFPVSRSGISSPASFAPTMFQRAFGAPSFRAFWRHWDPLYGYLLRYYCYLPLRRIFPDSLSLVITFAISGFLLHDLVIWGVVGHPLFPVVTFAFVLLAGLVLVSSAVGLSLRKFSPSQRAIAHATALLGSFMLSVIATFAYYATNA